MSEPTQRLLDIVAPDTGPTARAYRRDIADRIAAIEAEARADAEATIQRLRTYAQHDEDLCWAGFTDAGCSCGLRELLADTAPEGEG